MASEGSPPDPARSHPPASPSATSWPSHGASDDTIAGTLDGELERSVPDQEHEASSGSTIDRYVVLAKLGGGGMGVVYVAHDPELDRKVALKLLRVRGSAERVARGHRRLLAEAQALARLSDPHVVTVHDVGEHDGQVFVAMELVEGRTLAAWLAQGRRSWSEILDVLVQAGRGLAAAHARELVHRDLKPDNVMVGDDGRVRVMDFGLAQELEGTDTDSGSEPGAPRASAPPRARLDGLAGTPAYMAPEQIAGERGSMASDQFSYCVTAWEALHGRRPFQGETLAALASAILAGTMSPAPADARVPAWLRRIVERGLAVDPARRWPSMAALLTALERGRTRSRSTKALLVVTSMGMAAAVGLGWHRYDRAQRVRACEDEGATIAEVWNEDDAEAVRRALAATGVGYAEVTAHKLIPWLDAHTQAWREARSDACLQTDIEGTWERETLERSRWCLDERRDELEALVAQLQHVEAKGVDTAVSAVTSLDRIEPCADPLSLSRQPFPPLDQREAVAAVRAELGRSAALVGTGAYEEGLAVARAALERAEALEWPPLVASARLAEAVALLNLGEYASAETGLEQAFFEAMRADAFEVAADAAGHLTDVVGDRLARPREGMRWARLHELVAERLPDPSGLFRARALQSQAIMHLVMGEYPQAKALYERAIALEEQSLGPEHLAVASAVGNLAIVLQSMGEHEQAEVLNARGLAVREQVLGPDHPDVGVVLHNLARDLRARGQAAEARVLYQRALRIWEASLGPQHPHVAQVLNNLGNVSFDLGDYEDARALHERALAVREHVFGPEHPQVAQSLVNLCSLELYANGASERATDRCERALVIDERALGPEHPDLAEVLGWLGRASLGLGDADRAHALLERALRICDASIGEEHPFRAQILQELAAVALAQGRVVDAVDLAQQSLRILATNASPAVFEAESRFVLAQALRAADEADAQARSLAEQARDELREHGHDTMAARVEAWLARDGAPTTGE